jgi:hypothetical protein
MKKTREEIEQIGAVVVDAMLKVHRALGPGSRTASSTWSIGYERVGGLSWRSSRLGGESRFTLTHDPLSARNSLHHSDFCRLPSSQNSRSEFSRQTPKTLESREYR